MTAVATAMEHVGPELRRPQIEAVEAALTQIAAKPDARFILSLPTGVGKTILGLVIIANLGRRALWLAEREELISQPHKKWRELFPGRECGIVKADLDHVGAANVIFGSVDTVSIARRLERLVTYQTHAGPIHLIIIDEAHHGVADGYHRILAAFPGVPVIGLTATPERSDKKPLTETFTDGLLYQYPIKLAIDEGFLVPPAPKRIRMPEFAPEKIKKTRKGDFDKGELEKEMLAAHAVEATVLAVEKAVLSGRKPLIFTISVEQSIRCAEEANKRGIISDFVHGELGEKDRANRLAAHASGKIRALFNCQVLTEGYDDTSIDAVVIARPTYSRTLYIQMAGRGLRKHPGKVDCEIYDMVGAHDVHGLQTADTLLADQEEKKAAKKLARTSSVGGSAGPEDPELNALRSFLEYVSGRKEIAGATTESAVKWLIVREGDAYVLPAGDTGNVLVERAGDGIYHAVLEPRDWRDAPVLLTPAPVSFEAAQTYGENHARTVGALRFSSRDAKWRNQDPSPGLKKALEKWHVKVPADVKMGQASDMLTIAIARARHGTRKTRIPIARTKMIGNHTFWVDL